MQTRSGGCHCGAVRFEGGVQSFAWGSRPDGTATVALNLRCVKEVDITKIERKPFDGRSR